MITFTREWHGYATGSSVSTLEDIIEAKAVSEGAAVYGGVSLPPNSSLDADNNVTGLVGPSGGLISPGSRSIAGDPYLMQVTGTTANQYYFLCDMAALGMVPGDMLEMKSLWSAPNTANAKTVSFVHGSAPDDGSVTSIGSTGHTGSAEVLSQLHVILWLQNATTIVANRSLIAPYGKSSAALNPLTIDIATQGKLYLRGGLAVGTDVLSLLACSYSVMRAGAA